MGDARRHSLFVERGSLCGDLLLMKGCGRDNGTSCADEVGRREDGGSMTAIARLQHCRGAININKHVVGVVLHDSVTIDDPARKVPVYNLAFRLLLGGDTICHVWRRGGREHNLSWLAAKTISAHNWNSLSCGTWCLDNHGRPSFSKNVGTSASLDSLGENLAIWCFVKDGFSI